MFQVHASEQDYDMQLLPTTLLLASQLASQLCVHVYSCLITWNMHRKVFYNYKHIITVIRYCDLIGSYQRASLFVQTRHSEFQYYDPLFIYYSAHKFWLLNAVNFGLKYEEFCFYYLKNYLHQNSQYIKSVRSNNVFGQLFEKNTL